MKATIEAETALHLDQLGTVSADAKLVQGLGTWISSGLASLVCSMLKIGLIGFGGGSALIPVIEDEVVSTQKLVCEKAYAEDVTAACVTPGALPVEIAAGVGRRAFGFSGMLLAACAMAFPGALLTVLILSALSGSSPEVLSVIQYISIGVGAFIVSLLFLYAEKTAREAYRTSQKQGVCSIGIMLGVLVLTGEKNIYRLFHIAREPLFGLSTVEVLLLAFFVIFLIGGLQGRRKGRTTGTVRKGEKAVTQEKVKRLIVECAVWLAFALTASIPALLLVNGTGEYLGRGLASSLMSFGGGDAYLTVADGLFVNSGILDSNAFYGQLVPIANVLPGSILCKILTGVGFLAGTAAGGSRAYGYLLAAAGFAVSVAASGFVFSIVAWLFHTFEDISIFHLLSKWIRPIISGLLLNVMLTMLRTNVETGTALGGRAEMILVFTVLLAIADIALIRTKKTNNLMTMGLTAVAGVAGAMVLI